MGEISFHEYIRIGLPPETNNQFWVDLRGEECHWIQRSDKAKAYAIIITGEATILNPLLGAIVGEEVLSLKQDIEAKNHNEVGVRIVLTNWTVPPKGWERDVQTGHDPNAPRGLQVGPRSFELD
jgi:hypothetical protein